MATTIVSKKMLRTAHNHMSFAGDHTLKSPTILLQDGFQYLHLTTGTTNKFEFPLIVPEQVGTKAKVTRFGFMFTCPDPAGTPSMTATVPALRRILIADVTGTDLEVTAGVIGSGYTSAAADTVYAPTISTPALTMAAAGALGSPVAGNKVTIIDFREADCYAHSTPTAWANNSFEPMDIVLGTITMANQEAAARWWGVKFYCFIQRKEI